jgi:hypothetical protein
MATSPAEPRVWNLRDKHRNPPPRGAVYCGRGTPYGNPYIAGQHGSRDTVIDKFEKFVLPDLDVSRLRGKHLLCWCKPLRCHCDSILQKANDDGHCPDEHPR